MTTKEAMLKAKNPFNMFVEFESDGHVSLYNSDLNNTGIRRTEEEGRNLDVYDNGKCEDENVPFIDANNDGINDYEQDMDFLISDIKQNIQREPKGSIIHSLFFEEMERDM